MNTNNCSCECGCNEIVENEDFPLCSTCNNEECHYENEDLDH